MNNKVKLIFNSDNLSYTISFFNTREEAEHWRDFLVYTMQEFKYEEMKIIEI